VFADDPFKRRIVLVAGTRPEAIKIAPLVHALAANPRYEPLLVTTGQHRAMLDQVLDTFDLAPVADLDLFRSGQDLATLTGRAMIGLGSVFDELDPSIVVVQGDTTTTLCGALAAFYRQAQVVHLEAGLRTDSVASPFPEEANRRMVTQIAALHLAATGANARNLKQAGVPTERVVVTGNTVIDALLHIVGRDLPVENDSLRRALDRNQRIVSVTAHRRESWGKPLKRIAHAIHDLVEAEDIHVVWPVHGNPLVRDTVHEVLGRNERVTLLDPLCYTDFTRLLVASALVISDSGGVQEEVPALGKHVLVLRDTTERMEAVRDGVATLVGTNRTAIVTAARAQLASRDSRRVGSPYGDGRAAERCVAAIDYLCGDRAVPIDFVPETANSSANSLRGRRLIRRNETHAASAMRRTPQRVLGTRHEQ
jgi:UDP-N-acetylglucosamine 2-epimerase (non-hydrolysing)